MQIKILYDVSSMGGVIFSSASLMWVELLCTI